MVGELWSRFGDRKPCVVARLAMDATDKFCGGLDATDVLRHGEEIGLNELLAAGGDAPPPKLVGCGGVEPTTLAARTAAKGEAGCPRTWPPGCSVPGAGA